MRSSTSPAFPGDALTARAVERAREGRTGIYDVAVRRATDDALLAEMRATSRVLPARPEQSAEAGGCTVEAYPTGSDPPRASHAKCGIARGYLIALVCDERHDGWVTAPVAATAMHRGGPPFSGDLYSGRPRR